MSGLLHLSRRQSSRPRPALLSVWRERISRTCLAGGGMRGPAQSGTAGPRFLRRVVGSLGGGYRTGPDSQRQEAGKVRNEVVTTLATGRRYTRQDHEAGLARFGLVAARQLPRDHRWPQRSFRAVVRR